MQRDELHGSNELFFAVEKRPMNEQAIAGALVACLGITLSLAARSGARFGGARRKQARPVKYKNWPGRIPGEPVVHEILAYGLGDDDSHHLYEVVWSDGVTTWAELFEMREPAVQKQIAEFWRAHGKPCPHALDI